MAVIEKIRVKLGVFITVLIAIALLSFILDPTTLQTAASLMSSKNKVGEINGDGIDYMEFQKQVDYYTAINQMMTGSTATTEEQNKAIQDMAWQSFIDKDLFLKNARAAGILVGEDELVDLTTGAMVSPMIAQNPMFMDESGAFSPAKVVEFVQNIPMDPSGNLKMYWDYVQDVIMKQQYYSKYYSLFSSSNFANSLMTAKRIEENNVTANVDFVMVPLGVADSTITVSDSEIQKYYNSHKDNYKQQASRDIEYVVFEVTPSDEDVALASESMDKAYAEFATASNLKNFLMRNSDEPLDTYYYAEGELSSVAPEFESFVFGKNSNGVSEIIRKGDKFMAARVADVKRMSDSAFVQHILLQGDDANMADSLLNVLKTGKNTLANIAMTYSADQNPNVAERGDIGWMTQSTMIPGFEAVLSAKVNEPFIINSAYGTHIVNIKERTKAIEKKQVAILVKEAVAGKQTFNDCYAKANDIATKSEGNIEKFRAACKEAGIYPMTQRRMAESARQLASYRNTREITRWAYEAKPGDVSSIITVDNNYFFVVGLTAIHKEGYTPLADVKSSIEIYLKNKKLADVRSEEVAAKIAGCTTMEAVAEALSTTVSSKDGIAFSSMTQQGFDPAFIGAVAGAQEGVVTGPVKGNYGVYVFVVKGRDTGSFYTEDDAKMRDLQMSQFSMQTIVPVMMEEADVKDNRARFY